jgi:ATP-dependent DNA helicase
MTSFCYIAVLRKPGIKTKLNNLLIQLRKNCAHPDLFNITFDANSMSCLAFPICTPLFNWSFTFICIVIYLFILFPGLYPPVDKLLEQCGKFQLLDRLLDVLLKRNHKVDVLFLFHSL